MPSDSRPPSPLPLLLLAAGVIAAYATTFAVPFVFDDLAAVTRNPSIEHLATAFFPPDGLSVTGRPLVNASLALNFALSGTAVWSYHAFNLGLHLGCAALLYTLLRRLSALGGDAGLAAAITALWALHPLQTAAVTYVMQRSELLVSVGLLGTLLAFARATDPQRPAAARQRWLAVSVLVCAAGMAAKEVMVVAPLLVLLYDRTFVAGRLAAAWRVRRGYYLALAGTWGVLAAVTLAGDNRGASAGLAAAMAPTDYALTQLAAIPHYLRLMLWPSPLVFDYGNALITDPVRLGVGAALVAGLLLGIAVTWRRRPTVAFAGAAFFLLLAPSSSVVPIATQTLAEHRVYLALAAPLAVVAVGTRRWLGARGSGIILLLAIALGAGTLLRNRDYASVATLWRDTAEKVPANARAHYNLGLSLGSTGDPTGALAAFTSAVAHEPTHREARSRLAELLLQAGRPAEALVHQRALLATAPSSALAHYSVAVPLLMLGRSAEALPLLQKAVRLDPNRAEMRFNFGRALTEAGRFEEALIQFDAAAQLDPADPAARNSAERIRAYLRR
jgi:Flp pilus assembly protein TadD